MECRAEASLQPRLDPGDGVPAGRCLLKTRREPGRLPVGQNCRTEASANPGENRSDDDAPVGSKMAPPKSNLWPSPPKANYLTVSP